MVGHSHAHDEPIAAWSWQLTRVRLLVFPLAQDLWQRMRLLRYTSQNKGSATFVLIFNLASMKRP